MKYKEWLDVWFANYIEPSSKTKTCERYSEIIEKHLKVKLGEYEQVSSYIGYLFGQYQPYKRSCYRELLKLNYRIALSNDNKRLSEVLKRHQTTGSFSIYGAKRHRK